MKRNLALNHVLLVQARRLAALGAEADDETRVRAIQELIRSLVVESDHRAKTYVVKVAILGKEYRHEVAEAELDFYRRGDTVGTASVEELAGAEGGGGATASGSVGARSAVSGSADDASGATNARAARALLVRMLAEAGIATPEAWSDPATIAPLRVSADAMPWAAVGSIAAVAAVGAMRGYPGVSPLWAGLTVVALAGVLRQLALPATAVCGLAALPAVAAWLGCAGHVGALGAFAWALAGVNVMLALEERRYVPGTDALAGWIAALPLAFDHTIGAAHVAWTAVLIGAGAYLAPWVFGLKRSVTLAVGLFVGSIGVYGDGSARNPLCGSLPTSTLVVAGVVWLVLALPHWFFGIHRGAVRLLLPLWALALTAALHVAPARCGAIEMAGVLALAGGAALRIQRHLKTGTVPDPLPETRRGPA